MSNQINIQNFTHFFAMVIEDYFQDYAFGGCLNPGVLLHLCMIFYFISVHFKESQSRDKHIKSIENLIDSIEERFTLVREECRVHIDEKFRKFEENVGKLVHEKFETLDKKLEVLNGNFKKSDENSRKLEQKIIERVDVENERIFHSMKLLERSFVEDFKTLEKTITSRLQDQEGRIEILEKDFEATSAQDNPEPPPKGCYCKEGVLPRVVTMRGLPPTVPTLFPVVAETKKPQSRGRASDNVGYIYEPIHMKDLKGIKEAVVTYGVQSSFVRQYINSWSAQNRVIPNDWKNLATAVLTEGQSLQWRNWFRAEANALESRDQTGNITISKEQILGEGQFADASIQATYDDHALLLCRTAALNAWEKVLDPGQRIESYTQIKQGPKEPYTEFIQRLTQAVNRAVSDSEVRKQLILSLAFDNANMTCKKLIMPLKMKGASIDEWIQLAINVEYLHSDEENWIGQAIANAKMRNQSIICFNCGKPGHIKRNCRQNIHGNSPYPRNDLNRRPLPPGLCRRCNKGRHWTNECRSVRDKDGNLLTSGNVTRGFPREAPKSQTSKPKRVHSYPVTMEEQLSQDE